ncbi:2,3-diaminopropionate biosynthesis protein SbnA [Nonomuraea insulae]|uniref:2,3-diaminopropionate biosynthesis protein SbnA n=1 Tax=Nonomuraea insulae TaxID=1616787 RepID=A0ABW1CLB1_9ACTN
MIFPSILARPCTCIASHIGGSLPIYSAASEIVLDDIFMRLPDFVTDMDVFLKLEAFNPAGSLKLKTAVGLVDSVLSAGILTRPHGRLIESSSGNLGIALSVVAAERGFPLTIVTDLNANRQAIQTMEVLGTEVVVIDRRDQNGGYLQQRIAYIQRELERDLRLIWLNQYADLANAHAHRDRTARNAHAELGTIDVLVVGVGSTGTLMGCLEYFGEHSLHTRIVAVDIEGSVTFGGAPAPRHIPGIGSSRRPEIFTDSDAFDKVLVGEPDTIAMCRQVARKYGLLIGGSTGSALTAVQQISKSIAPGSRVVVISPDLGDRYLDSIYSDDWIKSRYGDTFTEASGSSFV